MEQKKRPGRPPLGPEARTERVVAMMTAEDRAAAEAAADAEGESLSVYAAGAINARVKRDRGRRARSN